MVRLSGIPASEINSKSGSCPRPLGISVFQVSFTLISFGTYQLGILYQLLYYFACLYLPYETQFHSGRRHRLLDGQQLSGYPEVLCGAESSDEFGDQNLS